MTTTRENNMALFNKEPKTTNEITVRLWESGEKHEDGRPLVELAIHNGAISYEKIGLSIPEQVFLGVIAEWQGDTGYERMMTKQEFLSMLEEHEQIKRVRTWAKMTIKMYEKENK
jgi:hypothetical protein